MSVTALKIRLYPNPVLRKKAMPVKEATLGLRDTLSKMAQIMYEQSGVGLAGPQVGISEMIIVLDIGTWLYKLINPQIIKKEGSRVTEEGCLSIPGVCIKVKRAKKILLKAQDEELRPVTIEAEDLLACVFQHEIEHLKGKLIIDHASFWEKLKIYKRLKELKRMSPEKVCKLQL